MSFVVSLSPLICHCGQSVSTDLSFVVRVLTDWCLLASFLTTLVLCITCSDFVLASLQMTYFGWQLPVVPPLVTFLTRDLTGLLRQGR